MGRKTGDGVRLQSAKKNIWARRNKLRGGWRKTKHEEF
jgi:hypothetical protein